MPDVILLPRGHPRFLGWVLDRMPGGFDPIVLGVRDGLRELAAAHGVRILSVDARDGVAVRLGLIAARTPVVCVLVADGEHDPRHLPAVAIPALDHEAELVLGMTDQPAWREPRVGQSDGHRASRAAPRSGQLGSAGVIAARRAPLLETVGAPDADAWLSDPAERAAAVGLSVHVVNLRASGFLTGPSGTSSEADNAAPAQPRLASGAA